MNPLDTGDIRYGLRALRREWRFSLVAVLTLALTLGATIAAFTAVERILLRPLPYPDSGRLVSLLAADGQGATFPFSLPNYLDLKAEARSFQSIAAAATVPATLVTGDVAVPITEALVSGDFFRVLGTAPLLGRFIGSDDVVGGAARGAVAVVSRAAWRRWLGADPAIIGRRIRLNNTTLTIVGVAPATLEYPASADFWTPCWACREYPVDPRSRAAAAVLVIGRLASGVTLARASADVARVAAVLRRDHPDPAENPMTSARVAPLQDSVVGDAARLAVPLSCAVTLVLLVACANLASGSLARNAMRRPEIALRMALGATRPHIVRLIAIEGLLWTGTGGLLGLALARLALALMARGVGAGWPRAGEVTLDGYAVAFAAALTAGAALLVAMLPALRAPGARPGEPRATSRTLRTHQLLIGFDVALSVLLLLSAGVVMQSLRQLLRQPIGISTRNLVTFRPLLPRQYQDPAHPAAAVRFDELLAERLRQVPGITGVAFTDAPPLGNVGAGLLEIEGRGGTASAPGVTPAAGYDLVSGNFFSVVPVPLLRGRLFAASDDSGHPEVTVINQAMADRYWPGEDPLGKRFRALSYDEHPQDWLTVIGVVANVRYDSLNASPAPVHYVSVRQRPDRARFGVFVVRSALPLATLAAAIRGAVRATDPEAVATDVATLDARVARTTRPRRLAATVLSAFAAAALLLAALGMFGVLSFIVTRRAREIGIRMALGATRARVVRGVVGEVMRPAIAGLAVGVLGAALTVRVLGTLIFRTSPLDPPVVAGACALLLLVTAAAAAHPAARAARVDPIETLRAE